MNLNSLLYRLNKPTAISLALILLGLIAWVDHWSGSELSFSIFYLAPISLVAWTLGAAWGSVFAISGAVVWLTVDLYGDRVYSHQLYPFWNALVRLGFFLIVARTLAALRASHEHERSLARTDNLTGLANARSFYAEARTELDRARESRRPLSICYMDLDNFKTVNDTLGHMVGDDLLRLVGETLQKHLRKIDVPARLGGDEFALLLPECGAEDSLEAISRLRDTLLDQMRQKNWPVTFSVGLVTFTRLPDDIEQMVHAADELMYEVKTGGKNNVRQRVVE